MNSKRKGSEPTKRPAPKKVCPKLFEVDRMAETERCRMALKDPDKLRDLYVIKFKAEMAEKVAAIMKRNEAERIKNDQPALSVHKLNQFINAHQQ